MNTETELNDSSNKSSRIRLPKLMAQDFQHPLDIAALNTLKHAKGIDLVIRKLNEWGFERWYYINNIADNVRVSQRQCKKIHDMLRESCEILNVPEPQLYLDQDPIVNAYTFGTEQPFIVLQSGLVDFLSDDELLCVIAHEVGHIKCGHVLYKMMANFLSVIIEMIGEATLGLGSLLGSGLLIAVYEWDRKSELSSDRAGLLVVQNPDVSIEVLMKLAGGCRSIYEQFNKEEFLKQAEDYKELDSSALNKIYKFLQVYKRTHPFPALRAKEIKAWAEVGDYKSILDGSFYQRPHTGGYQTTNQTNYSRTTSYGSSTNPACPICNTIQIDPHAAFCFQCGTAFNTAEAKCCNCNNPIRKTDMFCPNCGINTNLG